MSFTISQLILYWLMQEFISAHSSSNKFWGNVVCMKMGAWLEQYDTHVPWPSLAPNVLPKFSWSTYIYIYSQWSKYIHNVCEKSCIWVPHPFCQKCHVISFSQQFIKVFILYDWSHNDFKCFYYSARGRQTLSVCTMPVQLHSRFQLSKPGRAWTGYSDWPHWNTVNCMHYVPSDLQSTKKFD